MRVEPVGIGRPADPVPETGLSLDGAEGEHTLAMAGSAVDGVRLSVVAWAPPPPPVPGPGPGPEPLPPDSTVTNR
jgi:hypothetical protein